MNDYTDGAEMLPGDEVEIKLTRIVQSFDGAYIETTDGESFYTNDVDDYQVTPASRPENWPPHDHDIWSLGASTPSFFYHCLGGEFFDEDGTGSNLEDLFGDSGYVMGDLKLIYRYTPAKTSTRK